MAAVLLVVGGLGLAWSVTRPSVATICTAAGSIDEVGASTPDAARVRWASEYDLAIDIERPDRVSGSGDEVAARYLIDRPDLDPSRTYFQKIVTERGDDGVWRVVSANHCEEWSER